MKEKFRDRQFNEQSLAIIEKVNQVIDEYAAQGFDLSVRQIFYQFVARNWLRNTIKNYEALAKVISEARIAGLVDWSYIRDRGRVTIKDQAYPSLKVFLQQTNEQFKLDCWANQANYIECMVEKQALEGVLLKVCNDWNIAFTANKGYSSSSTMYERAKFMQSKRDVEGKAVHVAYFSDLDPSGCDMVRDIKERLEMFSDGPVTMHNLALTYDQAINFQLPENPVKLKDSRSDDFVAKYGESSWELDALNPTQLAHLLTSKIQELTNLTRWEIDQKRQVACQDELQTYIDELT